MSSLAITKSVFILRIDTFNWSLRDWNMFLNGGALYYYGWHDSLVVSVLD